MDLGLMGLGVMGKNLVNNFIDKKYKVAIYNRSNEKTKKFDEEINDVEKLKPSYSLREFVESLKSPKIILLLIQAGTAVDIVCDSLQEYLKPGDVVVDLGNSNYKDTIERTARYGDKFSFVGCGISGGEMGARHGPSMMPGGNPNGWIHIEKMFKDISAKYEREGESYPCCEWIGPSGSGHFVKMIHNGIEYGNMAIIAETYTLLKKMKFNNEKIASIFEEWNTTKELNSYLLEISIKVLRKKDEKGVHFLEKILDRSENKGTGLWCITAAMDCQYHATIMSNAVYSRMISYERDKRVEFSKNISKEKVNNLEISVTSLKKSMIIANCLSYIQGLSMIKRMSDINNWNLSLSSICDIWKNGCIIRSQFLGIIQSIVSHDDYENTDEFLNIFSECNQELRDVVMASIKYKIPTIVFTSCVSYLDSLSTDKDNGNLIQALRDFFGAHQVTFIGEESSKHVVWE